MNGTASIAEYPAHILALAERGWPVFPCGSDKTPLIKTGFLAASLDPEQIRKWWAQWPAALVGVATGAVSGITVVDIDTKDGKRGDINWQQMIGDNGPLPDTMQVESRSGGAHVYLKYVPGSRISQSKLAPGIDVRSDGGYIICPPSAGYKYINPGTEIAEAPSWLKALLAPPVAAVPEPAPEPIHRAKPQGDVIDRARKYVAAMPPAIAGQGGHPATYAVATVLSHGFEFDEGTAFELLNEFNARCVPAWSEKELRHKLSEAITKPHDKPRGWLLNTEQASVPVSKQIVEKLAVLSPIILRSHADRMRDRFSPSPMLIDGAFPLGGVGAVVAMPGAGKTLISVEISRCVAAGVPFMGRATMQGRVLYACPDSPASTERRLLTIDDEVASRIDSIAEIPALPGSIPALREVVEAVNLGGDPVRLIVIDTWDSARSHVSDGYAGQDALIESAMGGLRKMAADLSLSVLVVHHATRADNGRARGSVVFDARADWIAVAEGDGRFVRLKSTKSRDGERGDLGSFEIQAVDVGGAMVPKLVAAVGHVRADAPDVGKQDYALLKHVVIREGKHTAASLAKDLGLSGKSAVARAADRLRASGYLNPGEFTPTEAGRAQIDSMFDTDNSSVPEADFIDHRSTPLERSFRAVER